MKRKARKGAAVRDWRRFALDLATQNFFTKASLDTIPFCIKMTAGDFAVWYCYRGKTAANVLGFQTFHLFKWWERDDVRCFTRLLCGEMLHRCHLHHKGILWLPVEHVPGIDFSCDLCGEMMFRTHLIEYVHSFFRPAPGDCIQCSHSFVGPAPS